MALYSKNFAKSFSEVLQNSQISCYKLSQYSHLDEGYLSCLRNGTKVNPSPETIVRICLSIAHYSNKPTLLDFEKLFNSTGRSLFPNKKTIT